MNKRALSSRLVCVLWKKLERNKPIEVKNAEQAVKYQGNKPQALIQVWLKRISDPSVSIRE
ncbi:hypothetical protein T08_14450 [Trichinella sp. T8]|nr:hypothetical protein T08_14450 [Trichinella sp. T8]